MEPQQPLQPDYLQQQAAAQVSPAEIMKKRIIVGGGIFLLLIILVIAASILFGGKSIIETNLVEAAARQTEIQRLINDHEDKARSLETQSLIARSKLLLASDNFQMKSFLSSAYGTSIGGNDISKVSLASLDEQFETSSRNNNFDTLFREKLTAAFELNYGLFESIGQETTNVELDEIVTNALLNYDGLL